MCRIRIFISALTLFFFVAAIRVEPAAQQDPQSNKPADKTSNDQTPGQKPGGQYHLPMPPSELVSLSVTVTDGYDRLVTGLNVRNFELFEDKVKQDISHFSEEDAPINLGIIFDVSGSMKNKLDRSKEALKAFVQTSHDNDDFFLVSFNQRANLVSEFTDGETLINKLPLVNPTGQTALYDATYLGVEKVKQGRHNRSALLLVSDGQDN